MRLLRNPRIELETDEEQNKAGRYNPGHILVYRHRRIPLACGSRDAVRVWVHDSAAVFVMSYSSSHGYAGMEEFFLEKKEKYHDALDRIRVTDGFFKGDSVFFQYDWELPEDFFDWPEHKMRDHLAQYLQ